MQGQKILIFGEGGHLFRTVGWVLEYRGYSVKRAPTPEAALALLIEENVDLVIARLHMEDLPSLDVLKRGRNLNPELGLVVVSGDYNAGFPLEAYQIEVDDYLVMPLTAGQLASRVRACLQKIADAKAPQTAVPGNGAPLDEALTSQVMLMLHDTRSGLVSVAAALKLLQRGKYGRLEAQAALKLQEISKHINASMAFIDKFAREALRLCHHL